MSVKPHASPVLHAIEYLLGELDAEHLTTLRQFGGLQSYPSRLEGSGAGRLLDRLGRDRRDGADLERGRPPLRRRPLRGSPSAAGRSRCWATPSSTRARSGRRSSIRSCRTLGEVLWIVDLNRQSLDRIVPDIAAGRIGAMFEAAGWQTITGQVRPLAARAVRARGRRRTAAPHRSRCRTRSTSGCCACIAGGVARAPAGIRPRTARASRGSSASSTTTSCSVRSATSGGTILRICSMRSRRRMPSSDRPSVIFAYTIKAWRLATEGHPANHSALLSAEQWAAAGRTHRR